MQNIQQQRRMRILRCGIKALRILHFLTVVGIIMNIGLLACGREEKIDVENVPVSKEQQLAKPDVAKENIQPAVKLTVKIIPDMPTVKQDIEAILGDGGNVSYRWEKNGEVIAGENTQRVMKERFKKGDVISVTVTVDGNTASASAVIQNSLPEVKSVPFSPQRGHRGIDISVAPIGFDADGDVVAYHYQWVINGEEPVGENRQVLKGDRFKRGDAIFVKVTPFDEEGEGQIYKTRPIIIPDAPPKFTSAPPQGFKGNTYKYNVTAEDPDGDAITYFLASAPKGMTIDSSTGVIEWQIAPESAGAHKIEVAAQDEEGLRAFQRYTLTITMPEGENK